MINPQSRYRYAKMNFTQKPITLAADRNQRASHWQLAARAVGARPLKRNVMRLTLLEGSRKCRTKWMDCNDAKFSRQWLYLRWSRKGIRIQSGKHDTRFLSNFKEQDSQHWRETWSQRSDLTFNIHVSDVRLPNIIFAPLTHVQWARRFRY